ncbi:SDR family oxidoreductase [Halomarina oriensis]|uniref:SDR family oxidoreductase n=1 Tax=Halomarina oriensis TaxID=671145 RepID=A0A6B0GF45_9EURY|nr:SDR family oxidoreductase [Halomarina oriensis]
MTKRLVRLVNIASAGGVVGVLNSAPYSAAKGDIVALTRQVAVDFARNGLRVNAVSLGFTDTGMFRQDTTTESSRMQHSRHRWVGSVAVKR